MRKWYMIHQIVNIIGYCIFRWPTIDFFQQWCYDLSPYTSPYTACFDNSPYGLWYGVDKRMVMDYNLILCGLMMNIWCSQVVKNVEWLPVGFRYPLIDETNQPRWTVEAFFLLWENLINILIYKKWHDDFHRNRCRWNIGNPKFGTPW